MKIVSGFFCYSCCKYNFLYLKTFLICSVLLIKMFAVTFRNILFGFCEILYGHLTLSVNLSICPVYIIGRTLNSIIIIAFRKHYSFIDNTKTTQYKVAS